MNSSYSLAQPSRWRVLRFTALVLLGGALCGCAQNLFYHPDSVLYSTPTEAGLAYQKAAFTSADGTPLTGWFIPAAGLKNPQNAKGTGVHFDASLAMK